MPNKKINELSPRTPSLTDLIIVGDPNTGYSYKATISVLTAFAGSNIQFSSLGGISLTSPANGQVLQFNGTSWVNYTPTTWNTAYDRSLVSAAVSGSTTKTLTLTKQDGSTLTATWSDLNTDAVTSVFGRTGAVVAAEGDYSLDLLSDVTLSTPTTNQVLQYNGTAWVNATFVAGINSLNGLTATTQTFATGTSGTDFAISSTTSTHTFNLPTASGTNRGALSSADWTTFNSKVGGSGTTNYLSKWTSSSALGNSLVFDNGTNVGIGTASPTFTVGTGMQVYGSSYSTVKVNSGAYTGGLELTFGGVGEAYLYQRSNGFLQFGTNNSDRMRITAAGRVLIGTTTESTYELDVVGDIRSTLDANINGLTVGKGGGSVATNTAVGSSALNANTTGTLNVALGTNALQSNITGLANTALGYESLKAYNSANGANVAVGYWASLSNTSGTANTIVGAEAQRYGSSGSNQTALGYRALWIATGGTNTALGYQAAQDLTTGSNNIIIGGQSTGVTTGSNNTLIGAVSGLSSSLSNTIILADGQGNQRFTINSSAEAAIGTSPVSGYRLNLNGNLRVSGTTLTAGTQTSYAINLGNGSLDLTLGSDASRTYIQSWNGKAISFQSQGNNVLIGTTTDAGQRLQVSGGAAVAAVFENSGTNAGLRISNSTYPYVVLNRSGTIARAFGIFNASGDIAIQESTTWSGANYHIFYGTGGYTTIGLISTSGSGLFGSSGTPNASAVLEATSTTKGFLPPRMTGAQAEAIATPAAGLLVYANNGNGTTITSTGWWGYNGTTWVKLN